MAEFGVKNAVSEVGGTIVSMSWVDAGRVVLLRMRPEVVSFWTAGTPHKRMLLSRAPYFRNFGPFQAVGGVVAAWDGEPMINHGERGVISRRHGDTENR